MAILTEQRLGDVRTQLSQYQKDIAIYRDTARHCCLLSTCATRLSLHQPGFSLPLPLFGELLKKSFKLNDSWQPKEHTSQAGLAATAVEQINAAVLPFVASCLSKRHFLRYLLSVCLEVWQDELSPEEQVLLSTVGTTLVDILRCCMSKEEEEEEEQKVASCDTEFYTFDKVSFFWCVL